MSSRSRSSSRPGSPLSMTGTDETEERLQRSSSRQRIESKFLHQVEDKVPIVRDAAEYLLSTYEVVKDSNSILKQGLEKSENVAYWMKQKVEDSVTAINLDRQLKKLDSAAANGVVTFDMARDNCLHRIEHKSKQVQLNLKEKTRQVKTATERIRYSIFETLQNMMDYVEKKFEPVMLPASPDTDKCSTKSETMNKTLERMVDVSYRLNLGILYSIGQKMKEVTDLKTWMGSFSSEHLRLRASIIRQEVMLSPEKELCYMDNKELTELDIRLIEMSRNLLLPLRRAKAAVKSIPTAVSNSITITFNYVFGLVSHFCEAKSLKDVVGIGIHESRKSIETVRNNVAPLQKLSFLNSLVSWMATQEKVLSGSG